LSSPPPPPARGLTILLTVDEIILWMRKVL
jgi:hypothetical protein